MDPERAALFVIYFLCVSVCFQVFSSLSLDLLPERAATLMVYDDVVQIVSGYQGNNHVCVCLNRLLCCFLFCKS